MEKGHLAKPLTHVDNTVETSHSMYRLFVKKAKKKMMIEHRLF